MMEKIIYEKLWEQTIKPKINRMLSEDNNIIFIGEHVKEKIWLTYEDTKNKVHTYMHNPDGRIDRHKVGSVMLYSIIACKPFEVKFLPLKQEVRGCSLLVNEILGFNTALAIVWSFLLEDAKEKCDKKKLKYLGMASFSLNVNTMITQHMFLRCFIMQNIISTTIYLHFRIFYF